ncbi:cell division protein ZapA [Bacteroides sp. 51]|uniref:cell division protein ZapA n=1 Tax=Bacteroides sp. 51 TaxID=2302938 RepID=UPI0013CFDDF9|nr:cell division protein ZapA [Bacteroides sp. 51]NDV80955.1 cell division protein ZapA [Bacteroides sp. 51]
MNDKIKINLHMADGTYPVFIQSLDDEEMVRKAAQQVNFLINERRKKFPTVDLEKILVMVAYQFSLEALKEKEINDTVPYTEKIKELTGVLEDYFRSE